VGNPAEGIFLKLTQYHEIVFLPRVHVLSFMLFLDCSSDHWKFESLLFMYSKPFGENSCIATEYGMVKAAVPSGVYVPLFPFKK
jgi:hypothetical protein